MWIVVTGNPIDGFRYFGPFKTPEEAIKWAEVTARDRAGEWWALDLEQP